MAESAFGEREFLYTPIKTPFAWYPLEGKYRTNHIVNGKFDIDLYAWNVDFGFAWAAGGVAQAVNDCRMSQMVNYTAENKNIRLRFTIKEIIGTAGTFLRVIIIDSSTGNTVFKDYLPGQAGIYDLFGYGDQVMFETSAPTTSIKIDDVEVYDANYLALLNENRPYCKNECPYKLITASTAFLPFILVRPMSATKLTSLVFIHTDGSTISLSAAEIVSTSAFNYASFTDTNGVGRDYIVYSGVTHGKYFKCGYWKGIAEDGAGNVWAGETFYIGNYGYGGQNLVGNGGFDIGNAFTFWQVTGPWTNINGTAHIENNGALIQDFGFNAPIKVRLKILDMTGTQTIKIRIAESGTGANPTDITITSPGNWTHTAFGGRIHISVVGASPFVTIDDAEAYALNGDPSVCHTKIHWYNTCDLFNIPYVSASFINILYLERKALTASPEWKEEIEVRKDGAGRERQTGYRKWKEHTLETGAIPEFIYDALSMMNAHNLKFVTLPDETNQRNIIIRYASLKNSWLPGECYTATEMTLIIEETYDTQCCDTDWQVPCYAGCYDVRGFKEDSPSPPDNTYYINHSDAKIEFWNGTEYVDVTSGCLDGVVKNIEDGKLYRRYIVGSPYTTDWYPIPYLLNVISLGGDHYRIDALIPPNTVSNVWAKDGAAGTYAIIGNLDPPLSMGPTGVTSKIIYFPAAEEVYFFVNCFTNNQLCNYGSSSALCLDHNGHFCPH